MVECKVCKKKTTPKRTLSDGLCNECIVENNFSANAAAQEKEDVLLKEFAEEQVAVGSQSFWSNMKRLLDVKFDNFELKLDQIIKHEVKEQIAKETTVIKKDVDTQKKDLKKANEEITVLKNKLDNAVAKVNQLEVDCKDFGKVSNNNMKYLINLDRNTRSHNVLIFGLQEERLLKIPIENENHEAGESNEEAFHYHTDQEKIDGVLKYIGLPSASKFISSYTRLGKDEGNTNRPLKIVFGKRDIASKVLSSASRLKSLEQKIYIKPDKTPKEREEYTRLLNRKKELMVTHPIGLDSAPRVSLSKGDLTVDGMVVDSYKSPQSIF